MTAAQLTSGNNNLEHVHIKSTTPCKSDRIKTLPYTCIASCVRIIMAESNINKDLDYDYVIIGSGFGGSVSALRLAEKGYSVLVLEKGRWFKAEDFAKNNWQIRKWLWEPFLGCYGIFRMTFLNHLTVVHGVGVGGGSLTYANTLPVPKKAFYESGSWARLDNWEEALQPYYNTAYRMLGAAVNPQLGDADLTIREMAEELGIEDQFRPAKVAVCFGPPGQKIKDPYFDGRGPDRFGCTFCGACMTGCRHGAKNTLDKNYLYLAQQEGVEIRAQKKATDVRPIDPSDSSQGYHIHFMDSLGWRKKKYTVTAKGVIFSGGVLGTVPLLLKLKRKSLLHLSELVGCNVRSNNESLMIVTSTHNDKKDYSKGLAIGSILHTDAHSHLEPTRYGRGSGFFRIMTMPRSDKRTLSGRLFDIIWRCVRSPRIFLKTLFSKDYAQKSTILLFMQNLNSTLRLKRGKITTLKSEKEAGPAPSAFIPEARKLGDHFGQLVRGIPYVSFAEVFLGNPTTAHILGGAVMGEDAKTGVIDKDNRVFGYDNMYVCDGSMISANPGVNPALSITAITEYCMSKIPAKDRMED